MSLLFLFSPDYLLLLIVLYWVSSVSATLLQLFPVATLTPSGCIGEKSQILFALPLHFAPPSPWYLPVSLSIFHFFPHFKSHPSWTLSSPPLVTHLPHILRWLHQPLVLSSPFLPSAFLSRQHETHVQNCTSTMSLPVNSEYLSLERIARYRHACSNGSPYATNKPIDIKPRGRRG